MRRWSWWRSVPRLWVPQEGLEEVVLHLQVGQLSRFVFEAGGDVILQGRSGAKFAVKVAAVKDGGAVRDPQAGPGLPTSIAHRHYATASLESRVVTVPSTKTVSRASASVLAPRSPRSRSVVVS